MEDHGEILAVWDGFFGDEFVPVLGGGEFGRMVENEDEEPDKSSGPLVGGGGGEFHFLGIPAAEDSIEAGQDDEC